MKKREDKTFNNLGMLGDFEEEECNEVKAVNWGVIFRDLLTFC